LSQIGKIRNFWKLSKDFLEFKNIIFDEKLSNKFKNGNKKFLPRKISREKSLNSMVLAYLSKKSQNHGNPFA
jgi:ADP-glucose pyrophosphorylase